MGGATVTNRLCFNYLKVGLRELLGAEMESIGLAGCWARRLQGCNFLVSWNMFLGVVIVKVCCDLCWYQGSNMIISDYCVLLW